MSNNSWKKYGGTSKIDSLNSISVGTIIADQFISRSVRPTFQFYNGTIEVTVDLQANRNLISGNSIYVGIDSFVAGNSYINNKLFFGQQNTLPQNTNYAYMYGNATNIGINTVSPKTAFNITGTVVNVTDILTVESSNVYIRNIIAQNKNQRGLVIDASDTVTNIQFYNDVSTNRANNPDANIRYTTGGTLSITTGNLITSSARSIQLNNSGGLLALDGYKSQWDSSGWFIMNTSGGYILNTSGGYMSLDGNNKNYLLNVSGDMALNTSKGFYLNTSGGILSLDKNSSVLSCSGSILLNSSAGLITVTSKSGTGNVFLNANYTQLTSFLTVTPPIATGRGVSGELYKETMLLFDNSNDTYLYDVYANNQIRSGNALTMVAVDNSSNTFFRAVAPNKRGLAMNGGVFVNDTTRSMSNIGLSDICGTFIPSQTIVSSSNTHKYLSTVGINTYAPRTENYVMDINGPIHIGNGEINTMSKVDFEIKNMSFSKSYPLSGIAVGTSYTLNNPYNQYALYTKDGGKTWKKSQVGSGTDLVVISNQSLKINVYDCSYAIIATTTTQSSTGFLFYTNDGGINWYPINFTSDGNVIETSIRRLFGSVFIANNVSNSSLRIFIPYINLENFDTTTVNTRYFDIPNANLSSSLNGTNFKLGATSSATQIISSIDIVASDCSGNYIYFVGNGISKFNVSGTPVIQSGYPINTGQTYNNVYAYSDTYVIAVGTNILSYTIDGTTWTDIVTNTGNFAKIPTSISTTGVNLRSVFIYDLSRAVAVGDNGVFIYTTTGPAASSWQIDISSAILNSSGMAGRITNTDNSLCSISMPDINSFIIANVATNYNLSTSTLGKSKILYGFLPNLMNRVNNRVFDICGNMYISGDINVYDGGKIMSNNPTFYLLNDTVKTINIGQDASFINFANFKSNTTLNGNLYVTNNTVMQLDVSMNSRLFVSSDVSFNNNAFVQGNITLPNTSNVYTNNLNSTALSPIYNPTNANLIGTINIGGNTKVTNIGMYGDTRDTAISNANQGTNPRGSYINIGSINPKDLSSTVNINIGNWTNDVTSLPNYINMGGGNDLVTIQGNVFFKNTAKLVVSNPIITLNTRNNQSINGVDTNGNMVVLESDIGTSAHSGIYINDNQDLSAGFICVSNDMSGYIIRPPNTGSNTLKLDVNSMTLTNSLTVNPTTGIFDISSGIVMLKRTPNKKDGGVDDSNYSLTVAQIDISNILLRNSRTSAGDVQDIATGLIIQKDVSLNNRLFVLNDVSMNGNVWVKNDLTINGRLTVQQYKTNSYVIATSTIYNQIFINEDMSLNGTLIVSNDVSFNSNLFVAKDVSANTRMFVGGDVSLNANLFVSSDISLNSRLLVGGDVSLNSRLFVNADVSMNSRLFVGGDVSLNSRLSILSDVSANTRLFVGGDVSLNANLFVSADISLNSRLFVGGDVSLNSRLFVNADVSLNSRLFVGGDVSLNSRLSILSDVSANKRLFVGGDVSLNSKLFVSADSSFNSRLFVGDDVSLNNHLYVNTGVYIGAGSGKAINSNPNTFMLDISAGNTNSRYYAGAMRIWEASGTLPTASGGTLFLQHGDASGVSSIVFPSTTNFGNDYASIAYYESISGGLSGASKYNYYGDLSSTSSSALVFNVQSNPYSSGSNVTSIDSIILQPAGSCIIDACGSTIGQTIIQPRGGGVGIGKINASYPLDVISQKATYNTPYGNPLVSYCGNFTILTYYQDGSLNFQVNTSFGYIAVGGGGGGGGGNGEGTTGGGGGGGGGIAYSTISQNGTPLNAGAQYTITIGSGGKGGTYASTGTSAKGNATILKQYSPIITALGGELGDSNQGGGAVTSLIGGTLVTNSGGNGGNNNLNGLISATKIFNTDIGYNVNYAGGGGGGSGSIGGNGGGAGGINLGGIAGGNLSSPNGESALDNTGGGGGGGGRALANGGNGGTGGSGIFIIYFYTYLNDLASTSINNSLLVNNGYVGIGNSNPNYSLDISSNSSTGTVRIGGKSTFPPFVSGVAYSGQLMITPTTNDNLSKLIIGMSYTNNSSLAGYIQSSQTDVGKFLLLNPMGGNVAIKTSTPVVSLDISASDAIRLPKGTSGERPTGPDRTKYIGSIRYNTDNSQFEGFGSLSTWGSLDGVQSINRRTFVTAVQTDSQLVADTTQINDELQFFTNGNERMRIVKNGDVSMNNNLILYGDASLNQRLFVGGDVSLNKQLFVGGDVSFNNRLFVGGDVSLNQRLFVGGDASFNNRLFVGGDVSLNQRLFVGGNVTINGNLTANYPNSSIPKTAIADRNIFNGDVSVYQGNFFMNVTNVEKSIVFFNQNGNKLIIFATDANAYINYAGSLIFRDINGVEKAYITSTGAMNAVSYNATSDYRIKENVEELSDKFNIDNLRPVIYYNNQSKKPDIGFIAHEIQEYFPYLVTGEKDGEKMQALNYTGLIGILVHEMKTLKKYIATQQQTITDQQKSIDEMRLQINEIISRF